MFRSLAVILLPIAAFGQFTPKADYFIALDGNDNWSGKLASPNRAKTNGPFASVAKAQTAVRESAKSKQVTVMLRGGTYYLASALQFSAEDSGAAGKPVTWTNYPGETPVLSGGIPAGKGGLGLTWRNVSGSLWQVTLPANVRRFGYLFYNGERRLRSRVQSPLGIGYYMRDGACYSTQTKQKMDSSQCTLGTFLRLPNIVTPETPEGEGCPSVANPNNGRRKCLDRIYYNPEDPAAAWANLNPTDTQWHKCGLPSSKHPQGDIEVTVFNSWSVDVMRVACIDTSKHVIYFTGRTFHAGRDTFNNFGPTRNHRYVVENTLDAFRAAQAAGQTGLWFLDRSTTLWTLNYLANRGENPNTDTVVIAQLEPISRLGGSLVSAVDLRHATFRGLTFEVDNYIPPPEGFNNDQNTEFTLPTALDCESCQDAHFDGIAVRHTSTTGILIASSSGTSGEPAKDDSIVNSAFYDMGDCGIRIGHGATRADKAQFVPQKIEVRNNLVLGYSRVFPDGEGIALSSGHDIDFVHNDIGDGYHTGLAVCFFGCLGDNHKANGSNILSQYNHIWDSMQGITSDGGTLYYNVGDNDGSATGNRILSNLVHDTTDAGIIDGFPEGYGGRGIYIDSKTAGMDVQNNVVYRVNQDVLWMSWGPAPGQPGHTFKNNIFAYGRRSMYHGTEWPLGCGTNPTGRAEITSNIFYFDRQAPDFHIMIGCSYSCGLPYSQFLNFQGNVYWRTDSTLASDDKAFHVITKPSVDGKQCTGRPNEWTYMSFADWQSSKQPVPWGPPGGMNLDKTGAIKDPGFGHTGEPSDFLLQRSPVAGFDHNKTNDTIRNAGRVKPSIKVGKVPATFPTYSYGRDEY